MRGGHPDARLTDLDENTPDLRLKARDGHDEHGDQEPFVQVLQPVERELLDEQVQGQDPRHEDEDDAAKKPFATRAFEEINHPPDHQADQEQLD